LEAVQPRCGAEGKLTFRPVPRGRGGELLSNCPSSCTA
jgi:hypothetical protein